MNEQDVNLQEFEARQSDDPGPDYFRPPSDCPNCHAEREWSGIPRIAACYSCGQSSPASNRGPS